MKADDQRVQAFRSDGSCFHVWTSAVRGEELDEFVQLGCVRELVFMLSQRSDRMDVFELDGPGLFAFPVIEYASSVTCGLEEVYVIGRTHVAVYSAADGTQLRTLPTHAPITYVGYSVAYGPSAVLAIAPNCYGPVESDFVTIISAADGLLLGKRKVNKKKAGFIIAWHVNSDSLWTLQCRQSSLKQVSGLVKYVKIRQEKRLREN